MSSFNQVILMGHVSRPPEITYLASQTAVVNFAVATNRVWTDGAGVKQESVMFIDCYMYGKRGEALQKYFAKGSPIHLVGVLILDTWEKDSVKHYKHKIKVDSWQFVAAKTGKDRKDDPKQDS